MERKCSPDILLVEDSPADIEFALRAIKTLLLAERVVLAKDGQEALDFLFARTEDAHRHPGNLPKLVLLNLRLPKISGLEVLSAIKADERTKSIPVVVFTSSQDHRDIVEAYRLGANAYVVKPMDYKGYLFILPKIVGFWLNLNLMP